MINIEKILSFLDKAISFVEAAAPSEVGAIAPQAKEALAVANEAAPIVTDLLANEHIDQAAHDVLQGRISAAVTSLVTAVSQTTDGTAAAPEPPQPPAPENPPAAQTS